MFIKIFVNKKLFKHTFFSKLAYFNHNAIEQKCNSFHLFKSNGIIYNIKLNKTSIFTHLESNDECIKSIKYNEKSYRFQQSCSVICRSSKNASNLNRLLHLNMTN